MSIGKHLLPALAISVAACAAPDHRDAAGSTHPTPTAGLADYCAHHACRKQITIDLHTAQGDDRRTLAEYWPAVQGDRISVLAGERLLIEARLEGNRPAEFRQVSEMRDPAVTLVFEFRQDTTDGDMRLFVHNPFAAPLKYHVDLVDTRGKAHQVSSCPVMARGKAVEQWSQAAPEAIISDLHLQRAATSFGCVY